MKMDKVVEQGKMFGTQIDFEIYYVVKWHFSGEKTNYSKWCWGKWLAILEKKSWTLIL